MPRRAPPRSLPLSAYVAGDGLAVAGGAAAALPPALAAAQEQLHRTLLEHCAYADERTRLQAALYAGTTILGRGRDGTVYRLTRVTDERVAYWQDPDYDLPPDWRESGKDYTQHLWRRDYVTRVDPRSAEWARWLAKAGLTRHEFFEDSPPE